MFLRVLSPCRGEQASCGRRLSGCWPFKRSIFTGAHSCMERGAQTRQWHTETVSVLPHFCDSKQHILQDHNLVTEWLRESHKTCAVHRGARVLLTQAQTRKSSKLEVTRFSPNRETQPFFFSKWISLKSKSDNEWELAIKTPLCTLYTNVPTFPHTCFDMQIAMKEIWKHSCPLLTNT